MQVSDPRSIRSRRTRWPVVGLAVYALLGGVATLFGWWVPMPRLTDWVGSGISMFANTALAATCAATALLLGLSERPWSLTFSRLLGLFVATLGGATLFEHLSGIDLGIDTLLINTQLGNRAAVAPGRMGPPASTAFLLIGIALLLRPTRARRLVPIFAVIVSALATLSITGYLFGADPLFSISRYTGIALQTATMILALGLGIVASIPEQEPFRTLSKDTAAGLLARRGLPLVILLPIALGWLRVAGQQAGWFDTGLGTALLVLVLIAMLCALLWWSVSAVTKREEALHQLAAIVESSRDPIISKSVDGIVTSWNPAAEALFGYTAGEMLGQSIQRVVPPDCMTEEKEILGRIGAGLSVGPCETLRLTRSGQRVPVSLTISPIKSSTGEIVGASSIVHDITERKRTEEALRHRSEQFETLIDSAPLGVYLVDADFRLVQVNPVAQLVFGDVAGGVIGRDFEEIIHLLWDRAYAEEVVRLFRHTLQTGESYVASERAEYRIDRQRTEYYEWHLHRITLPDGRYGLVCYFRDISQQVEARKLIEESRNALRQSETRLAGMISSAMDAVVAVDHTQRIVLFNPAAERMFQCEASKALGSAIDQFIPRKFREAHRAHIEQFGRTGDTTRRMGALGALSGVRAGGEEFPIEASISQMEIGGGKLFTVILRDITERKKAEDTVRALHSELQQHAAALETTVAERTGKLREMVNELQQVSYAMAHDMRAPLRAMSAFAQLILEQSAPAASPEVTEYAERIVNAAVRLDKLIQDALSYSKSVLEEVALEPVDLSRLISGLISSYPNLHPDHATIRIDGTLPTVMGNESLLTQCFSNLLGNAAKFVKPGAKAEVRLWAEKIDGTARIWVEDKGIGIPKYAQQRLFGMFQKLDNQYEGTGIGLAIVRKVTQRMGGTVGVESEEGKGSKFWVELPVAPEAITL